MNNLDLVLVRDIKTNKSTIGKLYINGKLQCFTLEDVERPVKIMHETCIPKGTYKVILNVSNRFKKIMPLLLGVDGFEGIRIHSGNTDKHTSGCILVGQTYGIDFIGKSREAFEELMEILEAQIEAKGTISIKII